jgi:hypothetical protein
MVSGSSQAMMASRGSSSYSQDIPRQMTGVHLTAYFGLGDVVMGLLKIGYDPDVKDSDGRTPLSWAAERGRQSTGARRWWSCCSRRIESILTLRPRESTQRTDATVVGGRARARGGGEATAHEG